MGLSDSEVIVVFKKDLIEVRAEDREYIKMISLIKNNTISNADMKTPVFMSSCFITFCMKFSDKIYPWFLDYVKNIDTAS